MVFAIIKADVWERACEARQARLSADVNRLLWQEAHKHRKRRARGLWGFFRGY